LFMNSWMEPVLWQIGHCDLKHLYFNLVCLPTLLGWSPGLVNSTYKDP
jgi:hypothetical protein